MVTVDCSRITGHDTLLTLVLTCASTWMEAALSDPAGGRRWIVYDEAWRVLRHPALIRRMQTQWKLSRAHGIANLMIIHRLSDLDAVGDAHSQTRALAHGLLADCSTRIVYRQETDQLPGSAAALGLTDTQTQLLPGLGLGQGLWRIHHHAHLIQHQLTPEEATLYDTTSRMRPPQSRQPPRCDFQRRGSQGYDATRANPRAGRADGHALAMHIGVLDPGCRGHLTAGVRRRVRVIEGRAMRSAGGANWLVVAGRVRR